MIPRRSLAGLNFAVPECEAPDTGEDHVAGHRCDSPDNAHGKAAINDIQDVLDGGKPEAGCRSIDNPVHGFIKLGMVIYREVDDKEFQTFLNHRGNDTRMRRHLPGKAVR